MKFKTNLLSKKDLSCPNCKTCSTLLRETINRRFSAFPIKIKKDREYLIS